MRFVESSLRLATVKIITYDLLLSIGLLGSSHTCFRSPDSLIALPRLINLSMILHYTRDVHKNPTIRYNVSRMYSL